MSKRNSKVEKKKVQQLSMELKLVRLIVFL
jgi:hypothetical protein